MPRLPLLALLAAAAATSAAPVSTFAKSKVDISSSKSPTKKKGKGNDSKPSSKSLEPSTFQGCMSSSGAPPVLDAYLMLSLDQAGKVLSVQLAGNDPQLETTPVGTCILSTAKKLSGLSP